MPVVTVCINGGGVMLQASNSVFPKLTSCSTGKQVRPLRNRPIINKAVLILMFFSSCLFVYILVKYWFYGESICCDKSDHTKEIVWNDCEVIGQSCDDRVCGTLTNR